MSEVPMVTVLIPVRNEEGDIEVCLRAVLAQDHPHHRMEILLVDGGSNDGTSAVASRVLGDGDVDWKIIDNPVGTTPSNLNAGLALAMGEFLCRVDARSIVPPGYVRLCAEVLASRPEVAVTGGAQVAVAVDDSSMSVGIARALNNRFAMGGSRYRSGASSGPSDTVYLGAFRTEQLRSAGGWDEFFHTNQDYELNRRMARCGTVWFDERLEVGYVPRQSLTALLRQYHRFGRWKVRYWRRSGDAPRPRQLMVLAIGIGGPPATVGLLWWSGRRGTVVRDAFLGLVFVALLEERGAQGPAGPFSARAHGVVALPLVAIGWVSGVLRGCFSEEPNAQ